MTLPVISAEDTLLYVCESSKLEDRGHDYYGADMTELGFAWCMYCKRAVDVERLDSTGIMIPLFELVIEEEPW